MKTLRDQAPRGGCAVDARRTDVPLPRSGGHTPAFRVKVFARRH